MLTTVRLLNMPHPDLPVLVSASTPSRSYPYPTLRPAVTTKSITASPAPTSMNVPGTPPGPFATLGTSSSAPDCAPLSSPASRRNDGIVPPRDDTGCSEGVFNTTRKEIGLKLAGRAVRVRGTTIRRYSHRAAPQDTIEPILGPALPITPPEPKPSGCQRVDALIWAATECSAPTVLGVKCT
ncbi:hypothetical protein BD779DRAFT_1671880 [Infundibulicybe gibba]|nr:hypothetical protein BD779DRAFT_1671880 [Infundibulicybe gibba]